MFTLPEETVKVKVTDSYKSTWIPEGKDGHLRWEGTSTSYPAPFNYSGVVKVLTDEEQVYLEKVLDSSRGPGWLSHTLLNGNVWKTDRRFVVSIPYPESLELNLNNPLEYVHYKILLANSRDIAPSYEESKGGEFLFYLEKSSEVNQSLNSKMEIKLNVLSLFSEVSVSFSKIYNFFLVAYMGRGANLPLEGNLEAAKLQLYSYTEDHSEMFLDIMKDVDYKYKVIYYRGLHKGAFVKQSGEIRANYANGTVIGRSIQDVVKYIKKLESLEDQKELQLLKERIK